MFGLSSHDLQIDGHHNIPLILHYTLHVADTAVTLGIGKSANAVVFGCA